MKKVIFWSLMVVFIVGCSSAKHSILESGVKEEIKEDSIEKTVEKLKNLLEKDSSLEIEFTEEEFFPPLMDNDSKGDSAIHNKESPKAANNSQPIPKKKTTLHVSSKNSSKEEGTAEITKDKQGSSERNLDSHEKVEDIRKAMPWYYPASVVALIILIAFFFYKKRGYFLSLGKKVLRFLGKS